MGSTGAKELAARGTEKSIYDEPFLEINPKFNLTRAQLASMTQALAYKEICEAKIPRARQKTTQMLAITRYAVMDITSVYPDDNEVWKVTWHQDFSKAYCTIIWKSLHNMHKIGSYWAQIPNFEHREKCMKCGVTEDLEHIILQCDIPGQELVWKNVKSLWQKKHSLWPDLRNIG
jgi:hypothetical protein